MRNLFACQSCYEIYRRDVLFNFVIFGRAEVNLINLYGRSKAYSAKHLFAMQNHIIVNPPF